ncbi:hypothetical protein Scep_016031 [Stephania cephalantha]|uniref:non-specific serine/threonine protein kinase n=1 Tax=Stephania cephalantha TaxID=152367 RepID=A0AAP0NSU3_9MAGN
MGVGEYWRVLLIFMVFCVKIDVLNCQNHSCDSSDLRALEGFLEGLESVIDGWGIGSSTTTTTTTTNVSSSSASAVDCCGWIGVSCDESSSRVVGLELVGKRLRGRLSDSLAGLDQLKKLNLSSNFIAGPVPAKLYYMQKLELLDLSYNDFHGSIPREINLPAIRVLDVSYNVLDGSVDMGICRNMTRIEVLNLASNNLRGAVPAGLGNCTSLQKLFLSSNCLSGNLPNELFKLKQLSWLRLDQNSLSGRLDGIGNLSNLVQLDISNNQYSGFLPDIFGSLGKLERFAADSNNFSGPLPSSLSSSQSLQIVSLRGNLLTGSINFNCTSMARLSSLDLGSNKFQGPLPDSLSLCRGLTALNLAKNNLNSEIPESFKNLQSLKFFSLSNTSIHNISSALLILEQCRNLTALVLTLNFRGEKMPTDANLHFPNLKALVIANCGLNGVVPQWLTSSTNLQLLDLSWNHLSGTIPGWFGSMKFLFYLDLSNNSFSGEIPKNLTELESFISRNISIDEPSPEFSFFMKRNQSGRGLQYNQIRSFPLLLDLSDNMLTGSIWPEFGNLKKLIVLDLKLNRLSGSIPYQLSDMKNLEDLDLSHNNLSGTLPFSLTSLSFLSKFSVAFNNLSGKIPMGGQFGTFPSSSFEGNKDLCYEQTCLSQQDTQVLFIPKSSSKVRRNKAVIAGMAIGIGSGTVFLLGLMFVIVTNGRGWKRNDPVNDESDAIDKDVEAPGSSLVVLFQNKETNKELSIDDIMKSTNNFDQANIIGCGGFGLVYRATLPDGRKVAIKRLSGECGEMEREFQAEVEALSKAQHPNLVLLQGYCRSRTDRLLIYSYMVNGSLDYWLHEKLDGASSLDWETRLRIARGAARGLAYLHQSCQPHILHRDVKSSNILLDENFEAHLADFGLARLLLPYDTHVSTDLVGTLGYIPPEYCQASVATFKGDVYSFGVVLLELLTGKRPMDMCKPKGFRDLISWVFQMKTEKRESEVFDPFAYEKQYDKQMMRVLQIACLCLSECPKARPSSQQVVSWLDNIDLIDQQTK